MKLPVSDKLRCLAAAQAKKEREYGEAYLLKGKVMLALFDGPVTLETESDYARYSIVDFMVSKMIRYASNFETGHADSLDDIAIYSQMLQRLDEALN